jgi:pyruvate dehydrogenase E2 component (dihydrolipoamide acetyltransferase)
LADVVMPQLGETVIEGTITKWLKAVGETVARDEPLFEVSTDKVDSEVPSPAEGTLVEIRVQEGETVDVGTVLAIVGPSAGAGEPSAAGPVAAPPPAPAPAPSAPARPPAPAAAPGPAAPGPAPVTPAPAVAAPAAAPAPAVPAARAAVPAPAPAGAAARRDRILSPVVRRLLDDHGIDPAEVSGTGMGGRITRADVLDFIDARRAGGAPAAAAPAPAPAARAAPGPVVSAPAPAAPSVSAPAPAAPAPARAPAPAAAAWSPAGTDEVIPFSNIRRRTAEHMVRSKATSPHTLVVLEADYEPVERVRRAHGARFRAEEGFSLTYLPFVVRATVEALHEWPHLNASVGDDSLIVHHQYNIGVAVDLDHHGLIVPVVKRAEELTLRGMARRIHELADRARTKKLNADDIAGGTFSLTNAGPFGTFLTAPIINQPQVGILSTDGVKRKPTVVVGDDGTEAIAIHSMGLLCLAWDHRAVDGAYAAAFLARVVEILGTHDWAAEL